MQESLMEKYGGLSRFVDIKVSHKSMLARIFYWNIDYNFLKYIWVIYNPLKFEPHPGSQNILALKKSQ